MTGFSRKKARPRITAVSASDTGLVRGNNEDHLLVDDEHLVYCVADGMGGGAEGERASELTCAEIAMLVRLQPENLVIRLDAACTAVVCANEAIHDYAKERGFSQMGTTLALLMFDPCDAAHAVICHVGDSRIYRIRHGLAERLTRDHRVPGGNTLTRAVGGRETVRCDLSDVEVRPGDRFLICTDGVSGVVSDARLAVFASGGTLETAAERLAAEVVKAGAPDNYSFVLVAT